MTATATAPKVTRITMRDGFDGVLISIQGYRTDIPHFGTDATGGPTVEMVESDAWMVRVIGLYSTTRGDRVGGVKEHSFGDLDEAREYANGWFAKLRAKGFRRTV